MASETHLHWIIWAYEKIQPETGNYLDNTAVDIVAASMEKAVTKAKTLVPGKGGYAVRSVIEHFGLDDCRHDK